MSVWLAGWWHNFWISLQSNKAQCRIHAITAWWKSPPYWRKESANMIGSWRENNGNCTASYYPEDTVTLTPAIDIFAFGMCALETAALELTSNGEGGAQVNICYHNKIVWFIRSFNILLHSVAGPALFSAASAPDVWDPGADSGSGQMGSVSAPGKKRRLPASHTKIFNFELRALKC